MSVSTDDESKEQLLKKIKASMENLREVVQAVVDEKNKELMDDPRIQEINKKKPKGNAVILHRADVNDEPESERGTRRDLQRSRLRQALMASGQAKLPQIQYSKSHVTFDQSRNKAVKQPIAPLPPGTKIGRSASGYTTPQKPKKVVGSRKAPPSRATASSRSRSTKSKTTSSSKVTKPKCSICGYRAPSIGALSAHRAKKHPNEVTRSAKKGAEKAKRSKHEGSSEALKLALEFAERSRARKRSE